MINATCRAENVKRHLEIVRRFAGRDHDAVRQTGFEPGGNFMSPERPEHSIEDIRAFFSH